MAANGSLQQKYEAEIGTYKTYTCNCNAYHVTFCTWCGCV